jgi:diguanylate cyclase (GGDEF)-like protein
LGQNSSKRFIRGSVMPITYTTDTGVRGRPGGRRDFSPGEGKVHPVNETTRIRSLAAMARALGRSDRLRGMLEVGAEEALGALGAASVSVSRLLPGTWSVRTIINVGDLGPLEERWPDNETYTLDDFPYLGEVMGRFATWIASVDDPSVDVRERALLDELGKGSSMAAPLQVDGRMWGEFYATRRRGEPVFDADDVAYLEALTAIVGGAVSRALREEALEELAYHDPLTGLLNRRALDEHAAGAFDVPAGISRHVTMVAIDINGLKQVNDAHGHLVGDQLLVSVAKALTKQFAQLPTSLVARVGGDEFAVMVPGHPPARVLEACDALCAQSWGFDPVAGVSCGAATAVVSSAAEVTPADLFAAADRAQYVAKHGRLTTTVLADDATPSRFRAG